MFSGFVCATPAHSIRAEEVHLWHINVSEILCNKRLDSLASLLCKEERSRMNAFGNEDRRQIFVIGRGSLRLILSALLPGITPESIALITNAHGKPALENNSSQLQFNLSHSHNTIVIALSRGRAVGVDVEYMKDRSTMADIAQHYFHPNEWRVILNAIESGDRRYAIQQFYKVWTLKEAFMKADGKGMAIPGDSFYFNNIDTSVPSIEFIDRTSNCSSNWHFEHQFIDSQYSMALALGASECKNQVIVTERQLSLDAFA